jgi:hypothetical protein
LANLGQNTRGNAGAQPNPLANMHFGHHFARRKFDSITGKIEGNLH